MLIKTGFNIAFDCADATPMVLLLSVRPERRADVIGEEGLATSPAGRVETYLDRFGNRCSRILAPKGRSSVTADFVIRDSGEPDRQRPAARQADVATLPSDALGFLMASRYCETDLLMNDAWRLFGATAPGWARVQAIVDFVHNHLTFGYQHARNTRTAFEGFSERIGVCRDFAHLAVTLCRCMNIPARYCTGYLGDIGVPRDPAPMDFSAWFEAFLDGEWFAFDARHNHPRIGRIKMAHGLDAADVAMVTAFGAHTLAKFEVWTDEIVAPASQQRRAVPAFGRAAA